MAHPHSGYSHPCCCNYRGIVLQIEKNYSQANKADLPFDPYQGLTFIAAQVAQEEYPCQQEGLGMISSQIQVGPLMMERWCRDSPGYWLCLGDAVSIPRSLGESRDGKAELIE